ncbi:MAG: hypothetical protein GX874_02050 [Smithella sp.]|nr:hypothetical protein [Smithella sp.]
MVDGGWGMGDGGKTGKEHNAPEPFLFEVLDFVRFLKVRSGREKLENAVMSESSLAKDWLKKEEDEVGIDRRSIRQAARLAIAPCIALNICMHTI